MIQSQPIKSSQPYSYLNQQWLGSQATNQYSKMSYEKNSTSTINTMNRMNQPPDLRSKYS